MRVWLMIAGLLMAAAVQAQPYQVLQTPQATEGEGVEVREFFSYGCPHCHDFEPVIGAWAEAMGDQVTVVKTPVTFGRDSWRLLSRAYYAAEALGIVEATHPALFDAIHEEGRAFRSRDDVAAFYAEIADVTETDVLAALDSFSVNSNVTRAERLVGAYRVMGTPAVGVAGKYLIDVRAAGGQQGMLEVAESLVAEESGNR